MITNYYELITERINEETQRRMLGLDYSSDINSWIKSEHIYNCEIKIKNTNRDLKMINRIRIIIANGLRKFADIIDSSDTTTAIHGTV